MAYSGPMSQASGAASHATMRELNRSLVLDVLRRNSPLSRAAIAKETRLAKPTVSAIVDGLIAEGLAREIGQGTSATEGGRPPILLEFNARSRFFAGVHIGVQRTHVVIVDARGAELERAELDTPSTFDDTIAATAKAVRSALTAAGAAARRLGAVGVCVPGLVDLTEGICLLAPNLGWRDVNVRAALSAALPGARVHVSNTAQACAVAETLEGAARYASDVVLLYAGTGVGTGIVLRGRLYRGGSGVAGEAGHVRVPSASGLCTCGKVGCLETVVSAPAVLRAAAEAGVVSTNASTPLTVEDVVRRAHEGDDAARQVLERAGRDLGLAASWIVNLLNPQVLVVGGGMAGAGDLVLAPLRAAIAEHSLPEAAEHLSIRAWSLGQEAKVRGAVLVAMQEDDTSVRLAFSGNGAGRVDA